MAKYSQEFKLEVVNYYLSGRGRIKITAKRFEIHHSMVQTWLRIFKQHGAQALQSRSQYNRYTTKLKHQVVQAIQQHGLSLRQAATQFCIREASVILGWLRLYEHGGVSALQKKARTNTSTMKPPTKPEHNKPDKQKTQQELLDELVYLRAENAYLKKLGALIQQEHIQDKKPESSQD